MRSPKAVNRSHSHHVFSVNSARGKGEAAKRRLATKKKWQHSLLGLNPYATKAAIVFATFDLKIAEADRLNEFSDEQQAEKSSTLAQMKAEKDMQNKAKKEREMIKKQQKQERKKIADAVRKEEEEKLAKCNVALHPTKESENKNSKTTVEPFSEESIKELSKVSSKKNKKNKKRLEPDSNLDNGEVIVVRNIEPTETPKNTPVDTPAEAPTTPAEETHRKRKAKKRKSESSGGSPEHKTEKHNEEYDCDLEKVPMVIEEVNVELDKTTNNMNNIKSRSASGTTKDGQHEQTIPSISEHNDSVDDAHSDVEQVVSGIDTKNISISEEPVRVKHIDSNSATPDNIEEVVEAGTVNRLIPEEPVLVEQLQQEQTASPFADHVFSTVAASANVGKVVSEAVTENGSVLEEPIAVQEQQSDPTSSSVSNHINSLEVVAVNNEVISKTGTEITSMSEEPVTVKTTSSFADHMVSIGAAPASVEEVVSETANEKGSMLEKLIPVQNVDAGNNKTDDEFEFVEHEEVEVASVNYVESEKEAFVDDRSATEEPKKLLHPEPTVNEHATPVDAPEPAQTIIDEGDQQRVSELEYSSETHENKEAVSIMDQDFGNKESAKKNKKKNKKDKKGTSDLHAGETGMSKEVITVISKTKDELDKIVEDENTFGTIAPIQVNEVTSTETDSDRKKIHRDHISVAVELDSATNPTQFAQNVQKLVNSTLSVSDFDLNDPNVKMTVQAQLVKVTEKEKNSTAIYEHKPITLAYERQRTVFERPSRERIYKLLNRDIVFCSSMIDAYGEDYESMAKDKKNVYRETARSIQRKIRIFKESPHYSVYLEARALGKDVSELLTEETS